MRQRRSIAQQTRNARFVLGTVQRTGFQEVSRFKRIDLENSFLNQSLVVMRDSQTDRKKEIRQAVSNMEDLRSGR